MRVCQRHPRRRRFFYTTMHDAVVMSQSSSSFSATAGLLVLYNFFLLRKLKVLYFGRKRKVKQFEADANVLTESVFFSISIADE